MAIAWAFFHVYTSYFGILEAWLHRAITFTFCATLAFLYFPTKGRNSNSPKKWILLVYDNIWLVATLALGGYMYFAYEGIIDRLGIPDLNDQIFGWIAIIVTLEITRRTVGNGMAILALCFLLYVIFGHYIPGPMGIPKISEIKIIDTMFNSTFGVFSIILGVMSTFIMIFVIFGAFLMRSEAGKFFINISYALTGHRIGGPAKVSVVASGFMGMVSGAAASNVVTTGTFTIPLMKKVGYSPEFAGAVESGASMGGQFMPPIMGTAAFLIAEHLRMPYIDLCLYALTPALLHFLAIGVMVHFEAQRHHMAVIPRDQLENPWDIVKRQGHLILPVFVIIFFLVSGYTPQKAGFWAILSVLVLTATKKQTRMKWTTILAALETGARNAIGITAVCACSGIIVGSVVMTGLGLKLSRLVLEASAGNIMLGLFFIMIASMILGMGMTTISAYVILGVLGVPALEQMGVHPLAAHLFVFYFAIFSNVTPPVAVTAYAAASVSGGDPLKTALTGFKVCMATLLIPYMFVFSTGILLQGSLWEITTSISFAVVSVIALASTLQGWIVVRLNLMTRLMAGASAVMLVVPYFAVQVIGLLLFGCVLFIQRAKGRTPQPGNPAPQAG
ncbi:MAG: TRAP transporter permease [Desulfarculaceae bacterium]|nr:TRAP transporter permease [Desulfarculaceae bacterium]